jgi:hypothetical protein
LKLRVVRTVKDSLNRPIHDVLERKRGPVPARDTLEFLIIAIGERHRKPSRLFAHLCHQFAPIITKLNQTVKLFFLRKSLHWKRIALEVSGNSCAKVNEAAQDPRRAPIEPLASHGPHESKPQSLAKVAIVNYQLIHVID